MNSKELFLNVAMELFAKYGYNGVSVREIAKDLGLRESAMYKHYSSKANILDTIILRAKEKLEEFQKDIEIYKDSIKLTFCNLQEKLFDFYTRDIFMNRFRKIMIISQYESDEAKLRYEKMFITKTLNYYEQCFAEAAIKTDSQTNAKLMAYELYSTLFVLLQQYDSTTNDEALELAKKILREHIDGFFKKYKFLEME